MGKKKTAVIGEEVVEEVKKKVSKKIEKVKDSVEEKAEEETEKETSKSKKVVKKAGRSRKYKAALIKIDRNKAYPLTEAVSIAQATNYAKFEGKIELHLTVREAGISGEISFPHSAGKSQRIAVATDELLEKIKAGQIDFDVLVAEPSMMIKLAPLAKVLGPKGLMPDPKKGTISAEPEKLAKEMAGKSRFTTEKKIPLIHLVVGSVKQPAKEIVANAEAVFKAVGESNILRATLKATMGPGVKVEIEK